MSTRAPYVGLRPFTSEDGDRFYGRDRDASFLADQLFSTPLTLLYARSGMGKTSVLQARLIPELRDEGVPVVVHDAWAVSDPRLALAEALVAEMVAQGLPAAVPGDNSLRSLTRVLHRTTGEPVVFVLDQFEVFLIEHVGRLDPLRRELGELLRADDLDCHILLSLREEYLAFLEPFKEITPRLFDSTFRLEALSLEDCRRAIVEPARAAGATWEPALVEALLEDLRLDPDEVELRPVGDSGDADNEGSRPVRLPFLQLVCRELWEDRERRQAPGLTLARYRSLGGLTEMLAAYVRRSMPTSRRDRQLMAELLRFLAPSSGLKKTYTAQELAELLDASPKRVRHHLRRLCDRRLMKVTMFGGRELFELEHDALIPVLAPWSRDIRASSRRSRRIALGLGGMVLGLMMLTPLVLVTGVFAGSAVNDRWSLHQQTYGAMDAAAKTPISPSGDFNRALAQAQAVRGAVRYIHFSKPGKIRYLAEFLKEQEEVIPSTTAWVDPSWSSISTDFGPSPLTLYVSPRAETGLVAYYHWMESSGQFYARGIPAPAWITFATDDTLPPTQVSYTLNASPKKTLNVPRIPPNYVKIPTPILDPWGQQIVETLDDEWNHIDLRGTDHVFVPPWSLPIWEELNVMPSTLGWVYNWYLGADLAADPSGLFNVDALAITLGRAESTEPVLVKEAGALSSEVLGSRLAAIVAGGEQSLVFTPSALDAALDGDLGPEQWSSELSRWTMSRRPQDQLANLGLRGPQPADPKAQSERKGDYGEHYRNVVGLLPEMPRPVRMKIGKELIPILVENGTLRPASLGAIERAREVVFRRHGVEMPGVSVIGNTTGNPTTMSLEVFHQQASDAIQPPLPHGGKVDGFEEALTDTFLEWRAYGLDTDDVDRALRRMDPALRAWLLETYTRTELKLILRAVVVGDGPGASAERPSWLLGGLVVAAGTGDPHDLQHVVRELRALQSARVARCGLEVPASPGDLALSGVAWADNLASGLSSRPSSTQRAIHQRGVGATQAELGDLWVAYAAQGCIQARQAAEATCKDPINQSAGNLGLSQQLDRLARSTDTGRPPGDPHWALCAWEQHRLAERSSKALELAQVLAATSPNPDDYDVYEAVWFGMHTLGTYLPGNEQVRLHAEGLVLSAQQRSPRLGRYIAIGGTLHDTTLPGLSAVCPQPHWSRSCYGLYGRLAAESTEPWAPLNFAMATTYVDRRDLIDQGLAAARHARDGLEPMAAAGDAFAVDQLPWATYAEAALLVRLKTFSGEDPPELAQAEEHLRAFARMEGIDNSNLQAAAVSVLWSLYMARDDQAALDTVLAPLPSDTWNLTRLQHTMWLGVSRGDTATVQATITELLQPTPEVPKELADAALFPAAVGAIITDHPDAERAARAFLETDHEYVHYVRILLSVYMEGKEAELARAVLKDAWEEINPQTWPQRMKEGDLRVWREMLLGRFVGGLPPGQIFDPLQSDLAFQASPLSQLPATRQSLLCEGSLYEALHAKKEGKGSDYRRYLKQAHDTGVTAFVEHQMAEYLLREELRR